MAHSAAHDAWDSQFPVDSAFLPSISALQEHCASYAQQLVQPTTPPATAIKPKAFPQLQLLRSTSPALSARRNASLRNLASLARGSPTSPRLAPTPLNSAEPTSGIDRRTAPSTAAATTAVPATATTVRSEQGSPVVSDEYVGKPIASTAQFLEWYSAVEEQLAAGQDQEAHAFAELLRDRSQKCSAMLQAIGDVRRMLAMMHDNYQRVCAQTEGVKGACQELQHRRDRLEHAQTQINETLRIYNSLPPIAQLFNAPGDRVCLDPEFLPSLERCEQAMEFLGEHGSAQDSELYLMRFAQCRVRALTLIKMHALRVFKTLAGEMARESAQSLSTNTLYMRFRATGRGLAPLARALHERAIGSGDGSDGKTPAASATGTGTERQMWADVVAAYFHVRRTWLRPYIKNSMDRIASECAQAAADADADANTSAGDGSQGVRVDALRDWCAFVMGLCADEFRLYYEFFDAPSEHGASMPPELRAYLDAIMAVFYEHVRPLVIHESDVHVLAGLSLTLLTYHRSSALAMAEYDHMDVGDDDMPRDSFAVAEEENGLDAFYAVVDQILQDAQQRLAYKAQSFIRTRISAYRVTKSDTDHISQWIAACQHLRVADAAALDSLVTQARITEDLQDPDSLPLPISMSSSFADIPTQAPSEQPPQSTGTLSRLADISPSQLASLEWVYPPVASYRWLVAQIDGCMDEEVQAGVFEEAAAACKQNLLAQGARFVRDSIGKNNNVEVADAEQFAHLFVTWNLIRMQKSVLE